jgi:hypothetical protein
LVIDKDNNNQSDKEIREFITRYFLFDSFILPAHVVLNEKGEPKNFDLTISGNKKINFVVNQISGQLQDSKKSGYSFIKPLARLSIAALVGFICWAYKNNISS